MIVRSAVLYISWNWDLQKMTLNVFQKISSFWTTHMNPYVNFVNREVNSIFKISMWCLCQSDTVFLRLNFLTLLNEMSLDHSGSVFFKIRFIASPSPSFYKFCDETFRYGLIIECHLKVDTEKSFPCACVFLLINAYTIEKAFYWPISIVILIHHLYPKM